MYLKAERRFDPASDAATAILAAVGRSFDDLVMMAAQDPTEHETSLYLSGWGFSDDQAATFAAGGMTDYLTDESPGGYLRAVDGALGLQVTSIYWRKTNAVHAWFVDECQGGIDECEESPVHAEQLAKLRSCCADALAAYDRGDVEQAGAVMAPRSGFFFGGTDIDDYWAHDLRQTCAGIERVVNLAAQTPGPVDFTYRASW